jgi:hypothetical protein
MQATRSEALVRSNRAAFPPDAQIQNHSRRTTAVYTCAAALLLLWMLLFVILSRLFTQDYVRNSVVAVGSLVLLAVAALYMRSRFRGQAANEAHDIPFGRRAREIERARQLRFAQQAINGSRPHIIRIIR